MAKPVYTRPFLKWAGGKYRVLPHIVPYLPTTSRRLIEPFVGSAVVTLNTQYDHYLLADINPDLINLYRHVLQQQNDFIRYARGFFKPQHNDSERFYALRERFNHEKNPRAKAALFLYLNRHGYNGLCRYNASGEFNVPFGRYRAPYFPETELLAFAAKHDRIELVCADFRDVFKKAKKSDVIYCDPPYVPLSKTANFVAYAKQGFGEQAQNDLAQLAERHCQRGGRVLISNHDTETVRVLYGSSTLYHFPVRRFISCNGNRRSFANELLAVYGT